MSLRLLHQRAKDAYAQVWQRKDANEEQPVGARGKGKGWMLKLGRAENKSLEVLREHMTTSAKEGTAWRRRLARLPRLQLCPIFLGLE